MDRNIDLFAEHMCPEGAVHMPFRGAIRVCKKLQIDYAEAVVGFEFGHRMAVPVIQGVVIAEEHHDTVMEEVKKDEVERARKEDEKRRKAALSQWRRFLMGMRIANRLRQDYGDATESVSVFENSKDNRYAHMNDATKASDENMAGGFLPEGYEEDEEAEESVHHISSFFPAVDEDDEGEDELMLESHEGNSRAKEEPQPATLDTNTQGEDNKATPKKMRQNTPATRRSARSRK